MKKQTTTINSPVVMKVFNFEQNIMHDLEETRGGWGGNLNKNPTFLF